MIIPFQIMAFFFYLISSTAVSLPFFVKARIDKNNTNDTIARTESDNVVTKMSLDPDPSFPTTNLSFLLKKIVFIDKFGSYWLNKKSTLMYLKLNSFFISSKSMIIVGGFWKA